jgi:transcriptional regulator with GAF, ATPase, and Fis domain
VIVPIAEALRSIARAKSVADICASVVTNLSQPPSVALVRMWVNCDGLKLMASGGTPTGGGSYNRLDGEFREMAIGTGTIAMIAERREPFVVQGIRGDEEWLMNPGWAARQGLRAFLAFPLVEDERIAGIFAIFDRAAPTTEFVGQLRLLADIAASRLAELQSREADTAAATSQEPVIEPPAVDPLLVVTRAELRQREKRNIEAALAETRGKVFGAGGAAALLGMRPTTLASRIKALKIR